MGSHAEIRSVFNYKRTELITPQFRYRDFGYTELVAIKTVFAFFDAYTK